MKNDKTFLGTEPVKKLLPRLAIPTVIAQLVNMLYNIVDRIYIGHIPEAGSLALTGLGVCMPLILIVSAFSSFVAAGGAPRASIFMGRGDHDSAEKTLGGCLTMQIIISLILTAVMLIWNEELLYVFGASENTISYAAGYMSIYALGTIFVQITLGLNAFITAQGFAKVGMKTVIIGAVLNIVLDPVFIFAFGMGVKGAALATVISQAVSCAWVISFLCGSKTVLRLKKENLLPGLRLMPPCIALGLSVFVMQASESVISMCFNTSLLRYGGDIAVGAMTILSSVAQPITSYNFGAGNSARVRESFRLLLTVCLVYSVALWGLVMLFPRIFVGMFASDTQLIDFASRALRIYCGAMFIFGIQISCQMTFVSIGYALCSIIVAVMRKFVLLIPLIYIMPQLLADKVSAVYAAEPVADSLAVLFTIVIFAVNFKKAMCRLEEK